MKTVAFCEIEEFPQKVLQKHWPKVPIYEDVRTLTAARLAADGVPGCDVVTAGFPCQPYSVAGFRMGDEDDRALWPEVARIVKEFRPDWFIGENVVGIVDMALDGVLADLEGLGYSTRTFDIPACAVGLQTLERHIWIVAQAHRVRREGGECKTIPDFTALSWEHERGLSGRQRAMDNTRFPSLSSRSRDSRQGGQN